MYLAFLKKGVVAFLSVIDDADNGGVIMNGQTHEGEQMKIRGVESNDGNHRTQDGSQAQCATT